MVNKKALITGATSGIGLEFAKALSKDDYDITFVSNEKDKLKEVLKSIPGNNKSIYADLTNFKDIEKIYNEISKNKYNLLINNAGIGLYGNFEDADINKLNSIITINCNAIMMLSHSFLKNAKEGDSLIIVSSAIVFLPSANGPIYVSTKAFNLFLGESLYHKQRKNGVYVMVLCPGATRTEFFKSSGVKKTPSKLITMSPQKVVRIAMKELKKRKKPIVIPGIKNKSFVTFSKFLPRKNIWNFMERF